MEPVKVFFHRPPNSFHLLSDHIHIAGSWQFFFYQMKSTRTCRDPEPHTQNEVSDWKSPGAVHCPDTQKLGTWTPRCWGRRMGESLLRSHLH